MQSLMLAIQAELRARMIDIRDGDIFISPHVNYIPKSVRAPCIGLKDGKPSFEELGGDMLRVTRPVKIVPWVDLLSGEASIIGKGASKGILSLAHDIQKILDLNFLGISGMIGAVCKDEAESDLFSSDKRGMQRKIITYEYTSEEPRWGIN